MTDSVREPDAAEVADVRATISSSVEMEQAEPLPGINKNEPVPGIRLLTGIMKATIFTDLFCYHADVRFLHPTQQERVQALCKAHPRFYLWCRNADMVARACLMGVIVLLATGIGAGTIYRLLWS